MSLVLAVLVMTGIPNPNPAPDPVPDPLLDTGTASLIVY